MRRRRYDFGDDAPDNVSSFHAGRPLEGSVDGEEAIQIRSLDADVKDRVVDVLEDHRVPRLGAQQALVGSPAHDCNRGELGGIVHPRELAVRRSPRIAVVDRERAEHLGGRRKNRRRPARPQAQGQHEVFVGGPVRMAGEVFDDHAFAEERCGAARAGGWTDGEPLQLRDVITREARRPAVAQTRAAVVEQQDGAEHPVGLLLDEPRNVGENLAQFVATGNSLEDAALAQLERFDQAFTLQRNDESCGNVGVRSVRNHSHPMAIDLCNSLNLLGRKIERRPAQPRCALRNQSTSRALVTTNGGSVRTRPYRTQPFRRRRPGSPLP